MERAGWPLAVLFDLDGTLVDSVPDIHEALNETLASYGEPPLTLEAVTVMVGRGVPTLIERAYSALDKELDPATRDRIVERFLALYRPRATKLTTLNAGASMVTRNLHEAGVKVGVVTNKPTIETREILDHFGLTEILDVIVGGDAGPEKKPAPGLLLLACEKLGIRPADALFVGDSENDVEAAKAAGIRVVVLRGGYTQKPSEALGADGLVSRLDELPETMLALA